MTAPPDEASLGQRAALVLLAIVATAAAWFLAAVLGPVLGTDAIWPFDRIGLVLIALASVENLASRTRAGGV